MFISFNGTTFCFEENSEAYISPYSWFFIDNLNSIIEKAKTICDYGAGTGVLGILSSTYPIQSVSFIEKNAETMELLKKNCINNFVSRQFYYYSCSNECNQMFDLIICNPASLPSFLDVNSFCNGGLLGIDMINEVIAFAYRSLNSHGALYIIITEVLPISLIKRKIREHNLNFTIEATREIPFRKHYEGLAEWVDNLKKEYSEMNYIIKDGEYFEKLYLFKITKGEK